MGKKLPPTLFDKSDHDWFAEEWNGMPEFTHEDLTPQSTLLIHFRNEEDRKAFGKLMKQTVTYKTKSLWYPGLEKNSFTKYRYVTENKISDIHTKQGEGEQLQDSGPSSEG